MGPSVKFVLAIIDSISKKKMGVNFVFAKLDPKGGGSEGFVSVDEKKSRSSFLNISLSWTSKQSSKFINMVYQRYMMTTKLDIKTFIITLVLIIIHQYGLSPPPKT